MSRVDRAPPWSVLHAQPFLRVHVAIPRYCDLAGYVMCLPRDVVTTGECLTAPLGSLGTGLARLSRFIRRVGVDRYAVYRAAGVDALVAAVIAEGL